MTTATAEKPRISPVFADIAKNIEVMSFPEVVSEILAFQGPIKLDFTRDFLLTLPLEKLQHILMTAKLYQLGKQKATLSATGIVA
jgi:hypothetical protein